MMTASAVAYRLFSSESILCVHDARTLTVSFAN